MNPHERMGHSDGRGSARATTKSQNHWATFGNLLPYLWPASRSDLKHRVLMAIGLMLLGRLISIQTPFFYKGVIDNLSQATALAAVPLFLILAYSAGRLLSALVGNLREAVLARVLEATERSLAVRTFAHLHSLSLRYHLDRRTGGLSRVIDRGTRASSMLVRVAFSHILPSSIELVFVSIILAYMFGVYYAVVTLATLMGYTWYTLAVTEWRTKIRRDMNDRDADSNTKAVDSLLSFEVVKCFGSEEFEIKRFDAAKAQYEKAAVRTTTSLSWLNAGQTAIFAVGLTALLVMAGFDTHAGRMTIGDFVLVNTYLLQLQNPLSSLGMVYRELKQSFVDMERLFDILHTKPDVVDKPHATSLTARGATITFDNVKFHYDSRRAILKDISFTVPGGQTYAIVGPSGAGKSTISRLLFRFYDVAGGRITIDGHDISDVTQSSLRAHMAMVPQDTLLFNDTIAYNIRYGRPDTSAGEIEQAARMAQLHDFIMQLPEGYNTVVGERGLKLSGGEKQRVAIARAILRDPPILILDEATSSLDTKTEQEIQNAIRVATANRTTLVIAHRLSTVVDADRILVVDHGAICEQGTHADLMAHGGIYADMWNRQRELSEAEHRLSKARAALASMD